MAGTTVDTHTIVATSPGDIVVSFNVPSVGKGYDIPVKSLSVTKSIDVSQEYGLGSHQAYAHVVGKITYEGDFSVGSWWVSDEANPRTWNYLVQEYLTYANDEGLPREFTITIMARGGESMVRKGTGTYGTSENTTGSTAESDMAIETYKRCILKGDGTDIPEVGGTVSKKYPFVCFIRDPK